VLWYRIAKDLIAGGSDARVTEAASFAISTAWGTWRDLQGSEAIRTRFLLAVVSVAESIVVVMNITFIGG
jgi:hypothetical protein